MTESSNLPLFHLREPPRLPVKTQRPPLLLLLHGIGSNESDLFALVPYLDKRFQVLSLRAPVALVPFGYGWYEATFTTDGLHIRPEQAEASRRQLIEFIEQAPAAYGADPDQVYLMGFSQGAIMSLAVMLTRPDLLAGVVAMSGRTLEELFDNRSPLGGQLASVELLKGFPLLVIHGRWDQVLSVDFGRATRTRFEQLKADLTYREYDMAHTVSQESLADITVWLSERLDGHGV